MPFPVKHFGKPTDNQNMVRLIFIPLILLSSILISCSDSDSLEFSKLITHRKLKAAPPETKATINIDECEDYLVLMSAAKVAKQLSKSKAWVKENFQIPVFSDTTLDSRKVIGHALPGAHCFIIRYDSIWFYIQSPNSNELGWVNRDYVVGFIKKDPDTLLPCGG